MAIKFAPIGAAVRTPVPRGISTRGPALLSYGFRPFFLAAGVFAVLAMVLWIAALTLGWDVGGEHGPLNWHAHEMLFGYASAALAGFMLTAIPNWTGRLPVSGLPLLGLVALWVSGRTVMLAPGLIGTAWSALIDAAFLPTLALVASREIVAGRNWKNLKILSGLTALSLANIMFHAVLLTGGDPIVVVRGTVSVYVALIALVGGRMVPSFSRNWLAKKRASRLPKPFGRLDVAAILVTVLALGCWSVVPEGPATAALAAIAAVLQASRLVSWCGWATLEEPILAILHIAYAFLPLGLLGVSAAALGWLSAPSALHILTVGAIGLMTLAVMTRATLGHTGRPLKASPPTTAAYAALLAAAVLRPFAEAFPDHYQLILGATGACWIVAFMLFVLVYGPMLLTAKPGPTKPA